MNSVYISVKLSCVHSNFSGLVNKCRKNVNQIFWLHLDNGIKNEIYIVFFLNIKHLRLETFVTIQKQKNANM